jgi:hypothetical protein
MIERTPMKFEPRTITVDEWVKEGNELFGPDRTQWRFVCPSCGHIAMAKDWIEAGSEEGEIAFSCVGRHMKNSADICSDKKPCNYAGGGLFRLNPVTVIIPDGKSIRLFEFDKKTEEKEETKEAREAPTYFPTVPSYPRSRSGGLMPPVRPKAHSGGIAPGQDE